MLPLAADWRERLGVPDPARIRPLEPAAGLDRDRWTTQEFGNVPLGDARLGQRLVRIASVQANDPLASFPSAAQGDRAAVKGYLRFTEQPDDAAVTPQGILAPHRARTVQRLQGVRPVAVMDREADIFELFAQQRELGGSDLLVRAQHNRCLEEGEAKLFDWIRAEPAQARGEVDVARLSARRATREQAASKLREERTAQVELRWREVRLPAPADGPRRGEEALPLWLVHVAERAAPAGTEALEWLLLTTVEVSGRELAEEVLQWYRLRWRIEDFFRVLKSGCEVERLAGRRAVRIARAVAINAVIAWRLLLLTLLGRDTPELPAELLFSEIEIRLLEDFAQLRRLERPDNLGKAVLAVAIMGGYLNFRRKRYAAPGAKVLWTGLVRLSTSAQTVERALALKGNSRVAALFRSD